MNQMEIFKNPEFGAIRAVEIDGEPWLVGKDVALALGYRQSNEGSGKGFGKSGSKGCTGSKSHSQGYGCSGESGGKSYDCRS